MNEPNMEWEEESWFGDFVCDFVYEPENNWIASVNGKNLFQFIDEKIKYEREKGKAEERERKLTIGKSIICSGSCGEKVNHDNGGKYTNGGRTVVHVPGGVCHYL